MFTLAALLAATIIARSSGFTLITFDVDGTLVRGGGAKGGSADSSAHSHAFGAAVGAVLGDGQPTTHVAKALPVHQYHGSTDGLILLRLARADLGVEPSKSAAKLDDLMDAMYEYIAPLNDEQVAHGINTLPGVLSQLEMLASMKDEVACGLVTGNVEGIARRKMKAVGVLGTGALAPPSAEQLRGRAWPGADDIGFLGGFGSDYCSCDIDDESRNHLDRAEQIAIAARRCRDSLAGSKKELRRVVHVGDAPADVLAAKSFAEVSGICVGMVAVATGSYSADQLRDLAGKADPGRWEPIVLNDGMADPAFLRACGVV